MLYIGYLTQHHQISSLHPCCVLLPIQHRFPKLLALVLHAKQTVFSQAKTPKHTIFGYDVDINLVGNRRMAQVLLAQLAAGEAKFSDVLAFIEAAYTHTPTAFKNGLQHNAATENQGSAKVFSFAQLQGLDQAQTLSLFAEHYASVLATPDAIDHQNIRQFMLNGWDGIEFDGTALTAK